MFLEIERKSIDYVVNGARYTVEVDLIDGKISFRKVWFLQLPLFIYMYTGSNFY